MGRMTMNDKTDEWKERPNTTAIEQNQEYYISKFWFGT